MDSLQSNASNSEIQSRISDSLERLPPIDPWEKRQLHQNIDALVRSERENRLLFERNPLPMWIFDLETLAFLDVNEAAIADYGYSRQEFLSMTLHDLRPSAEDSAALLSDLARHDTSHHRDGPWRHRKKNGAIIDVEITSAPIEFRNQQAKFVMAADITARRAAELKLSAHVQSLARSNNDLKQFANAASHDLQEPLRNVILFTQLLAQSWGKPSKDQSDEYIKLILEGANTIQALVEGLRRYWALAESEPGSVQPVNTERAVKRAIEKLQSSITAAKAVFHYEALPMVTADERELTMLFEELFSNAVKFRSNSPLEVRISGQQRNRECLISVQDNGIGMNPVYTARIFGIFKRLSRSYPGTGMGLAIAQKIVERHGGRVWAESQLGQGCTIHFTLPVCAD